MTLIAIFGHQAFFTREAMENIAKTTLGNLADFQAAHPSPNLVKLDATMVKK